VAVDGAVAVGGGEAGAAGAVPAGATAVGAGAAGAVAGGVGAGGVVVAGLGGRTSIVERSARSPGRITRVTAKSAIPSTTSSTKLMTTALRPRVSLPSGRGDATTPGRGIGRPPRPS
jgi:hypothetical protein